MPDNVVEVDFPQARLERASLAELIDIQKENATGLSEAVTDLHRLFESVWRERAQAIRRARRAERELLEERARNFPSDEAVRDALSATFTGRPVAAKVVAVRLGLEPTLSACIRVGLALSRLRARGLVESTPEGENDGWRVFRWSPKDGDDA